MSAIDSLSHVHVGFFHRIPMYWVIEEDKLSHLLDNEYGSEKVINQHSLVIGGGSGEHPALIIDIDAAIYNFMCGINEIEEPDIEANDSEQFDYELFQLAQNIEYKIQDEENDFKNPMKEICDWSIDTNQWPLKTFVKIASKYDGDGDLEDIILVAMALFVIYEMPLEHVIKDQDLLKFAQMVKSSCWQDAYGRKELAARFSIFEGVLNGGKFGKIIRDNKVVWGYSLSDWYYDQGESLLK